MTIDSIRQLHLEAKRKNLPVAGITVANIDALFVEISRLESEVNLANARTTAIVVELEKVAAGLAVALAGAKGFV